MNTPDGSTPPAEEIAQLRLALEAVEKSRSQLRAENATLRARQFILGAALDGLQTLVATSSRDWGLYRVDAWIWALLCGWDCKEETHDETCVHGTMELMQQRHGWSNAAVDKARRYRNVIQSVIDGNTIAPPATLQDRVQHDPAVHACPPDGSGLTPCCNRSPFEMQGDRMTNDPASVTCNSGHIR